MDVVLLLVLVWYMVYGIGVYVIGRMIRVGENYTESTLQTAGR